MPDIGGPFPQNQRIQYNRGQPPSPYGTPGLWPGQQAPQVNPWDAVGPPPGAMESGLGSLRRGQNASEGYTRSLQDNTPWIGQQPGINRLFGMAGQNADSPLGFMPGPTVADQSALTRQAAGAGGGLLGRGVGAPAGEDYYR